jgi:DNA-binding NarL/FixJ family response regulator
MISVLVADDQGLIRKGLRMLLEAEPDLRVVGEAGDGTQALAQARAAWTRTSS